MFNPYQIFEKKSSLFSIIVVVVVGILAAPIILPHILHTYHFVHILLHIGGIILAVFLTVLSLIAYYRLRSKRLMLTFCGFGAFITAETVTLIDATWPATFDIDDLSLLEIGHLLILTTLGLLALGVFRDD